MSVIKQPFEQVDYWLSVCAARCPALRAAVIEASALPTGDWTEGFVRLGQDVWLTARWTRKTAEHTLQTVRETYKASQYVHEYLEYVKEGSGAD